MTVLIGNIIKVQAIFKDANGDVQDPAVVQVRRLEPGAGSPTAYVYGTDSEVERASKGVYYILNDTTAKPGTWQFVWNSSGTYQAAGETEFTVAEDYFST